jgi:hypothetical protein
MTSLFPPSRFSKAAIVGIAAAASLPFSLLLAQEESDHDHDHMHDHEVVDESSSGVPATRAQAGESHTESLTPISSEHWLPRLFHGMPIDFGEGAGVGANIGGFLFPEIFVQGVFGDSTADPADLAIGDHDPNSDATLQSLHFALEMEIGDFLSGFVNYDGTTDAGGHFSGQLEEGFIHIEALPWLSVGGGQFLNSFGFHNERHIHAWDFVDQYLASGRMLNEGELTTQGGEVIFTLPTPWESTLTIGGGGVRNHGHGDGHAHGHGEVEPAFEADGANFDNWVVTGNYRADYGRHENMAGTVSTAIGENGFGKMTQVYGIGHEIVWNPEQPLYDDAKNTVIGKYRGGSFGPGSLRWRSELMYRNVEAYSVGGHEEEEDDHVDEHHGEEEHHEDEGPSSATLDEFGLYTQLQYGITDLTTASLRGEWVSGVDGLGLEERWRISPSVGVYLTAARNLHLRLQYNYDYGEDFGEEHSVWLQFGLSWGAPSSHGHHKH